MTIIQISEVKLYFVIPKSYLYETDELIWELEKLDKDSEKFSKEQIPDINALNKKPIEELHL